MTSRERVMATLDFTGPDRLPTNSWALPSAWIGREDAVTALRQRYPDDMAGAPYDDPLYDLRLYQRGTFLDAWGCRWVSLHDGFVGEVKEHPLADYDRLRDYQPPWEAIDVGWANVENGIAALHEKYIGCGGYNPFERMQFLRGTERLYLDLAEENDGLYALRDLVFTFFRRYIERWLRFDVDGIHFSDDWGSQRGLLISPASWRRIFKPKYRELFEMIRNAGKRIFLHSDGNIADLFPDWVELGVDAINSQVWCMGLETLRPWAGRITFWGELDRQRLLPYGTPGDIRQAACRMVKAFYRNGGLIGQCEIDHLTSLENIDTALSCWKDIPLPTTPGGDGTREDVHPR